MEDLFVRLFLKFLVLKFWIALFLFSTTFIIVHILHVKFRPIVEAIGVHNRRVILYNMMVGSKFL